MAELIRGASGAFTLGKYHLFARLNWWQDYCVEENYSLISVSMELMADGWDYVDTWYTQGDILCADQTLASMFYTNPTTHKAQLGAVEQWVPLSPSSAQGKELPWVSEKIYHNADGTGSVTLQTTAIRAYRAADGSRGIGTLDPQTLTLTTIPRASAVTAAPATLGMPCAVTFTPAAENFTYALELSLGEWSRRAENIAPNTTESYTYTGLTLPMDLAWELPDTAEGEVAVTLTTYGADGAPVGSRTCAMAVTVPQTEATRPQVSIQSLTAADTPFEGLFVQNKSALQGALAAEGRYGATITALTMTAEGKTYSSPWRTERLTGFGELTVKAVATDSRGFTAQAQQTISVIPYARPQVSVAYCRRCDPAGNAAEDGECLAICARRTYHKVVDDTGAQRNFCAIRYRYAPQDGAWSDWQPLLSGDDLDTDTVTAEPLLEGLLSKAASYRVAVGVVDTAGGENEAVCTLATEAVFLHQRAGGKGLGLGRYCESDELVDVAWNVRLRGQLLLGDEAIPLADYIRAIIAESTP